MAQPKEPELPSFPTERPSRLMLAERSASGVWDVKQVATESNVIACLTQLPRETRQRIAGDICPELRTRLERAEEVVEAAVDCTLAVNRARKYLDRYPPENLKNACEAPQANAPEPVLTPTVPQLLELIRDCAAALRWNLSPERCGPLRDRLDRVLRGTAGPTRVYDQPGERVCTFTPGPDTESRDPATDPRNL